MRLEMWGSVVNVDNISAKSILNLIYFLSSRAEHYFDMTPEHRAPACTIYPIECPLLIWPNEWRNTRVRFVADRCVGNVRIPSATERIRRICILYTMYGYTHTHTPFEVTLRWINETWIARKKCLEAFESEKKYCRDIRKFENLAFRNRFRAAKKKKLCYIACLILSLIFRLCEMAAAAVAARRHRRLIEKHISALYTIFFFIIFLLLFFSLVIVSVGLGVRVSLSHTLFIRSFSSRISFAYFIGVWWCGDAVGLCLVVLNSASSSSCVSFLRVEFISTQRYTFIISIRIRLGDRSSLPQFVCAKALHSTRRYNIPFSITHYYFPFWFGYMFRYIFYLRSFFVLPKSFAPFCDKHR